MIKKKEVFSSIFDAAAQMGKKKPKEPLPKTPPTPPQAPPVKKELPPSEKQELIDVNEIFKRCTEIYSTIKKTIENAYMTAHLSPKEIDEFLSTPSNFSSYQWKIIQQQKKELSEKLQKLSAEFMSKENEEIDPKKEPSKKVPSKGIIEKSRWVQM